MQNQKSPEVPWFGLQNQNENRQQAKRGTSRCTKYAREFPTKYQFKFSLFATDHEEWQRENHINWRTYQWICVHVMVWIFFWLFLLEMDSKRAEAYIYIRSVTATVINNRNNKRKGTNTKGLSFYCFYSSMFCTPFAVDCVALSSVYVNRFDFSTWLFWFFFPFFLMHFSGHFSLSRTSPTFVREKKKKSVCWTIKFHCPALNVSDHNSHSSYSKWAFGQSVQCTDSVFSWKISDFFFLLLRLHLYCHKPIYEQHTSDSKLRPIHLWFHVQP